MLCCHLYHNVYLTGSMPTTLTRYVVLSPLSQCLSYREHANNTNKICRVVTSTTMFILQAACQPHYQDMLCCHLYHIVYLTGSMPTTLTRYVVLSPLPQCLSYRQHANHTNKICCVVTSTTMFILQAACQPHYQDMLCCHLYHNVYLTGSMPTTLTRYVVLSPLPQCLSYRQHANHTNKICCVVTSITMFILQAACQPH